MQATLKSPIIGKTDEQVKAEADALDTASEALAQRYAQPNWFNVAAGFLKPQLGGFGASLGSAAQALGENLEKQRENQLPLYAVRAQAGAMKSQMANRQLAAKAYEDAKRGNFDPEGLPALQATLTSYGAPELADSVGKMIETRQKDRGLASSEQGNAVARITLARSMGVAPNPADLALVASGSPTAIKKPEATDTTAPKKMLELTAPEITPPKITPPTVEAPAAGELEKNRPVGAFDFERTTLPSVDRAIAAIPDQTERERAKKALDTQVASMPKKILSSEYNMESGLTPDQLAKVVKPMEDIAESRYAGLMIGAPEQYAPRARVLDNQINLIKNNSKPDKPDGSSPVSRVTSVLSQGKVFDGILAALNEGVGISLNGLSANLRAPIETFIRANFEKEDRELAMAMANNYASIALMQQQVGKVNPNSARNAEIGLYNSLTPNMDTTPNAAMRSLLHLKHDLDMTRAQYEHVTSILTNKHPTLTLKPKELARFSTAFDPQYLEKINEPFAEKHNQVESAFQRSLGKK
jgi:hypothetical protein